jgi:hypothetical protein
MHIGTDGVRRSRTAIRQDCACSKNPRLEKRMWWQESFAEGMVFTNAQPAADVTEFGEGLVCTEDGKTPISQCVAKSLISKLQNWQQTKQ